MKPLFSIVLAIRLASRKNVAAATFSDKDLEMIERIVRKEKGFESFSISKLKGFWNGASEDCVEIRILSDKENRVMDCAQKLRRAFKQESVLLTCQGCGTLLS